VVCNSSVSAVLYRTKKARDKPAPTEECEVTQFILFLFSIETRHKVGATVFACRRDPLINTRVIPNSFRDPLSYLQTLKQVQGD
jgi:hypothetical protein